MNKRKGLSAHNGRWSAVTCMFLLAVFMIGPDARAQGFPGPGPFPPGPSLPGGPGIGTPPFTGPLPGLPGTGGQGMMVFDPAHIAETIANGKQILTQIENQVRQIEHEVRMLEKLTDPPWRDIERRLWEMEDLLRQGEAISYSVSDLGRLLEETFPGVSPYVDWTAEYERQLGRSANTQENVIMSLHHQGLQMGESQGQLQHIKETMSGVEGQTGALELGNTLSAFTAEELLLIRQLLTAQTNALAAYHAHQISREARVMATRRALYEADSTPLPGKTFTGGSSDIFR